MTNFGLYFGSSWPSRCLQPQEPVQDPRVQPHIALAESWQRRGLRGEAPLGVDSGISVFSAPQDQFVALGLELVSPLRQAGLGSMWEAIY